MTGVLCRPGARTVFVVRDRDSVGDTWADPLGDEVAGVRMSLANSAVIYPLE